MSGVLGDRDRLDVVTALRQLAEIDAAKRQHRRVATELTRRGHRLNGHENTHRPPR